MASQEGKEYIRQTITLATGLQILRFKQERHYGTCKHLHLSLEREEVKLGVHLVIEKEKLRMAGESTLGCDRDSPRSHQLLHTYMRVGKLKLLS